MCSDNLGTHLSGRRRGQRHPYLQHLPHPLCRLRLNNKQTGLGQLIRRVNFYTRRSCRKAFGTHTLAHAVSCATLYMEHAVCTQNCLGQLIRPSSTEGKHRTGRSCREAFGTQTFAHAASCHKLYTWNTWQARKQFGPTSYGRSTMTESIHGYAVLYKEYVGRTQTVWASYLW